MRALSGVSLARYFRSTHAQLLFLIFGVELLLIAIIMFGVLQLVHRELDRKDAERTLELRDDLLLVDAQQGRPALTLLVRSRARQSDEEALLLLGPDGAKQAGNIAQWPRSQGGDDGWHVAPLRLSGAPVARPYGFVSISLADGSMLLAGHLVEDSAHTKTIVKTALVLALLITIPLAFAGAWIAVRLIDRRVSTIAETARAISSGDFDGRVGISGSGDPFDRLAMAINAMLDRLVSLVSELRLVTDSLAHDLRSPLTRLRARIDRSALDPDDDRLRDELQSIGLEADQLLGMLSTSLEISRAEAGIGRQHMEECDIALLLNDLAELYAPLVEEQGRDIATDPASRGVAMVHRELLGRAVANLVDNALHYGAGTITLGCRTDGDKVSVWVQDQGEGISPADSEAALRRFGRLDAARSTSGAGLGLSLVAAVARLHGGAVTLLRPDDGFRIEIVLDRRG